MGNIYNKLLYLCCCFPLVDNLGPRRTFCVVQFHDSNETFREFPYIHLRCAQQCGMFVVVQLYSVAT